MEALLDQVRTLGTTASHETRLALIEFCDELKYSLETPPEMLRRMGRACAPPTVLQIAIDLKLFNILSKASSSVSDADIAKETGADPALIARITRSLACFHMIKETGPGQYTSNRFCEAFSKPDYQATFTHMFQIETRTYMAFPRFLAETKYKTPTDVNNSAFQKAFNTTLTPFQYAESDPKIIENLGITMSTWDRDLRTWLDAYPITTELPNTTDTDIVFVDVGGGFGQQARALKAKYPQLKGRIIVQDLPKTVENAPPSEGVEYMAHDFFQPQTVQGGKIYYLRTVLHDWPDKECITILTHLAKSLEESPSSKILIDEISIPATNAPSWANSSDLVMMANLAAKERSRAEWVDLFDKAGLKINRDWVYEKQIALTVMELVRK